MKTIFNPSQKLEIERKLKITVHLPQTCHFCDEAITKFGWEAGSLCFHSLDGNHDNWIPSNKTPCHRACHMRHHSTGVLFTEERKQNISKAKKGKPQPWSRGDKNPMRNPEVAARNARARIGVPLSEEHKQNLKKAWDDRRERYGPSGVKDLESHSRIRIEAAKKTWNTRRERYGPSGMKPKPESV